MENLQPVNNRDFNSELDSTKNPEVRCQSPKQIRNNESFSSESMNHLKSNMSFYGEDSFLKDSTAKLEKDQNKKARDGNTNPTLNNEHVEPLEELPKTKEKKKKKSDKPDTLQPVFNIISLIDDLENMNKTEKNKNGNNNINKETENCPENDNNDNAQTSDKFCKICFDTSEGKKIGKLIAPCICDGSMKFIHDECLKTWLVSQNKDIQSAGCEICNTSYIMTFRFGSKFFPRQAVKDGYLSLISSVCLFVLIVSLITVIIIFSMQWNQSYWVSESSDSQGDNQGEAVSGVSYKLAIIISCSVISLILMILFGVSVKDACFITEVKNWQIMNWRKVGTNEIINDNRKKKVFKKNIHINIASDNRVTASMNLAERLNNNNMQVNDANNRGTTDQQAISLQARRVEQEQNPQNVIQKSDKFNEQEIKSQIVKVSSVPNFPQMHYYHNSHQTGKKTTSIEPKSHDNLLISPSSVADALRRSSQQLINNIKGYIGIKGTEPNANRQGVYNSSNQTFENKTMVQTRSLPSLNTSEMSELRKSYAEKIPKDFILPQEEKERLLEVVLTVNK